MITLFTKQPKATKFIFFVSLISLQTFSQQKQQDSIKANELEEVLVSAVRITTKTPITFSNVSKKEIAPRNLGQDIPILLNYLPSVVTTSDAGNGVGYTGIRVRGSDATRVNVTINGIPYNDSESHGTYWVNMPDFASSLQSIQLQRGVGTSTNGAGAFGASLNMLTDNYSVKSSGEIANSFGSFSTRKHTVKFSTGLLDNHFEIAGRMSALQSDGYIDRASSDLKSYFLQGTFVNKNALIKALAFGGKEKTYQSWNGIDAATLAMDRTFNTAGLFTDATGKTRFYENETDNYQQDHFQLHWNQNLKNNWTSNLAFFYSKGKGYYENYKEDSALSDYGLESTNPEETTYLVVQKWLDNDFYGSTFSVNYKKEALDFVLGGGHNKYEGSHFGKVIWARNAANSELGDKFYDDDATKTDANIFAKATYQIDEQIGLYADMQYRNVTYKANAIETGNISEKFDFFNPKAGINIDVDTKNKIYFSYARAQREPNRTDFENGSPKPEKLNDFELGLRHNAPKTQWNANFYYMAYKDQLVLTGELDQVGSPIRQNSGDSYRLGVEIDASITILNNLSLHPNMTLSTNKNKNFKFQRDGIITNLGDTNISYSPEVVFGNNILYKPLKGMQLSVLTKWVGDQYMGNIDAKSSILKAYFVNDLSVSYEIKTNAVFESITISGLLNNFFDYKYESNGYFYTYDDDFSVPNTITTIEGAAYYPQAGINFLAGLSLKF